MRLNKISIITGIAILGLAITPAFAVQSDSTARRNNVSLGMTTKAPYAMKRISKVKTDKTAEPGKTAGNRKAPAPTTQKPGQASSARPMPPPRAKPP